MRTFFSMCTFYFGEWIAIHSGGYGLALGECLIELLYRAQGVLQVLLFGTVLLYCVSGCVPTIFAVSAKLVHTHGSSWPLSWLCGVCVLSALAESSCCNQQVTAVVIATSERVTFFSSHLLTASPVQ